MKQLFGYIIIIVVSFCFQEQLLGQEVPGNILTAITSDVDGQEIQLKDRLDPNVNYVLKVGQFWCAPCRAGVRSLMAQRDTLRLKYNTEVIILESEHFLDREKLEGKKRAFDWDFPIYTLKSGAGFFGISAIPRYFFVRAGGQAPWGRPSSSCGRLPIYIEDALGWSKEKAVLKSNFTQTITSDCNEIQLVNFDGVDVVEYDDNDFARLDGILLREEYGFHQVRKWNEAEAEEELYLDYSLSLCNEFRLEDRDGDFLDVRIEEVYEKDGRKHLVSDKFISNGCGPDLPFIIIQGFGSNGGLLFDIEGDKVVSRLACHKQEDSLIYQDEALGEFCQPSSTSDSQLSQSHLILPNPVEDLLTIYFQQQRTGDYQLIDSQGMLVFSNSFSLSKEVTIETKNLIAGSYLLRIVGGEITQTSKFIKL